MEKESKDKKQLLAALSHCLLALLGSVNVAVKEMAMVRLSSPALFTLLLRGSWMIQVLAATCTSIVPVRVGYACEAVGACVFARSFTEAVPRFVKVPRYVQCTVLYMSNSSRLFNCTIACMYNMFKHPKYARVHTTHHSWPYM
jgi:hypothetical protein